MNCYNFKTGQSKGKPENANLSNFVSMVSTSASSSKDPNTEVGEVMTRNQNSERNSHKFGRVFTGSVERVIKWHRLYPYFCYYEVIASVIAIQESPIKMQKMMLLRDRKGPILQVVYYSTDRINMNDFFVGQTLRCLGHMIAPSMLHALSIRAATDEEVTSLQRMAYVCDHAIARAMV